jgi:hypothetical protein
MTQNKMKIGALLFLALGLTTAQAQQATTASGGDATGTGGSVNYSVGQVAYTTQLGSNGSVAQGVQQAYVISVVTGIDKAIGISLNVTAYPNPTTDYLTIKTQNVELESLVYQLIDLNGKEIESNLMAKPEASISMLNLASGIYYVKVSSHKKEVKTFKIIKN